MGTSAHAFGRVTERLWCTWPLGSRMKLRVGSADCSATVHRRRSDRSDEEGLRGLGPGEEEEEVVVVDRDGDRGGEKWGTRGGIGSSVG